MRFVAGRAPCQSCCWPERCGEGAERPGALWQRSVGKKLLAGRREVRKWSAMPIIVISARTQENEKVLALDLGADDYITKPFGTSELLARIRTAVRHLARMNTANSTSHIFRASGLVIDFDRRRITVHEQEVHLTQVEYKIVSMLANNSGKVITYDTLISHVWGPYADDNNRILRVNMANIRRKLERNPAQPEYIFTEIGIGYRMIDAEA